MIWVIILVLLGALLLVAETMVPGGVLGFVGAALIVIGIVTAYSELPVAQANWVLAAVSGVLVIGTIAWLVWFPTSGLARHLSAHQVVGNLGHDYAHLLGQSGSAKSALRPSGIAEIAGVRLDVISEGSFIEPGCPVIVVAVEGSKIVVRPEQPVS